MKRIFGFIIVALISASSVMAQTTITQTRTFTGNPGYDRILTFDQFDNTLGTLNSIQVIMELNTTGGYLVVDNDGDDPAEVTVRLGADGHILSSDVALLDASFQPVLGNDGVQVYTGDTFTLASENGDGAGNVDPTGPDGATHTGGNDTESDNGYIGSAMFSQYYGTGTYTITMRANSIIDFGGVGGVEGSFGNTVVDGELTIIYNYTPFVADLSLTKSVSSLTPELGDNIVYTIEVTNDGPDTAVGVEVEDVLPSGVTYVSHSGGTYSSASGVWTVGDLTSGSSATLEITAEVTGTGSISNTAQVSACETGDPDSTPDNDVPGEDDQDSAGISVPSQVDLELDKQLLTASPDYKDNIVFQITVTNTSIHDNATGVTVTDLLPAGLTYVSDNSGGNYNSSTGVWTVGTVNSNGGSRSIQITARVDATGEFTNFAQVSACNENDVDSTPGNGDVGEDDDDKVIFTIDEAADLRLEKSVNDATPDYNDLVTFTITVTNDGPDDASGVTVSDVLPAGLTYNSDNGAGAYTGGVWTVGNLANGASASLEITARATGTGDITNTAQVATSDQYDPDSNPGSGTDEDDDDDATVTIPRIIDLELDKSVNNATPRYMDTVVFTVTVTNTSTFDNATGVQVKDLLPAGLTYVSDNSGGNYNSTTGIWTVGTVNVNGGSRSIQITARVTDTGSIENYAQVWTCNEDDGDSTPGNDSHAEDDDDYASITVDDAVDLELTKTVSNSAPSLNDEVTFTITVTNQGPDQAAGVTVTDPLPAGLSFVSSSGGDYNSGTGLWIIGDLNASATATLQITARVTRTGAITNTAQVRTCIEYDYDSTPNNSDPDEDDQDDASLAVPRIADLRLSKVADDSTPNLGDEVTFTMTVTNDGPDNASGIAVEDILPAGLEYVSDNGSGAFDHESHIWTLGDLNSGANASLEITTRVTGTGTISNTAQVSACMDQDPDSTPDNDVPGEDDQDAAELTVAPAADLELEKTVDNANPNLGDDVTFTLTLTNNGPDNPTTITVNDVLPAGLTYRSSTPSQGSFDDATGNWTVGGLASSHSATLTITAEATATGSHTNSAQITASNLYDPDSTPGSGTDEDDDDTASVSVAQSSDLSLTKSVNNGTPDYGETVVYTVTVFNDGPDNVTGVEVEDVLPNGMTFVSDNSGGNYDEVTGIWTLGNLANGASASIEITAQVNGTGTIDNIAQVHASNNFDIDSTPDNDNASEDDQDNAQIVVPPVVDLELSKVVDNATPVFEENVTFTLTVANTLPHDDASGVVVEDVLPAGMTFVSATGDGSYNDATGVWTVGTVARNSGTATLNITASMDYTGTRENFAEISACNEDDFDSTPNNGDVGEDDDDKLEITVAETADLSLVKNVNNATPNYLDTVTYTLTLTNDGPDNATGVLVEDVLPAGLAYQSQSGDGTFDAAAGLWTVGDLGNGASATIQITVQVTGTGEIDNIAQVNACNQRDSDSTPDNDDPAEDDQDNALITVPPVVDLELTKSVSDPTPNYRDRISFRLQVRNTSPHNDATGVQVGDHLPRWLAQVNSQGDGEYNPQTGIWDIGTVTRGGGTATITIYATIVNSGRMVNFAEVYACNEYDYDSEPGNGSQGEDDDARVEFVIDPAADLSITKEVDMAEAELNEIITYTLDLYNHGPDMPTDVQVTDLLPEGLEFVSADGNGSYDPATGVWDVGSIESRTHRYHTLQARITTTGPIVNSAQVTRSELYDPDSRPANNIPFEDDQDAADLNGPPKVDLELEKTVDIPNPKFRDIVTFTLSLINQSEYDDASGVSVADMLPDGLTYITSEGDGVYDSATGLWTIGDVAKDGGSAQHLIRARVDAVGSIVNFAQVHACNEADLDSYPDNGPAEEDDEDQVELTVGPAADLRLDKQANMQQQYVLEDVAFTITVTNDGPSPATGVSVTDELPAGLVFLADSGDGSYQADTGLWTVGDLAVGQSKQMQIHVSVTDTVATIINSAQVATSDLYDPDSTPGNGDPEEDDQDSAQLTSLPRSDLRLTKSTGQDTVGWGEEIVFTIRVFNDGPDDATGVVIEDALPPGLVYQSHSAGNFQPVSGLWNLGVLPRGQSATLNLTATAQQTGAFVNIAQVHASDNNDPDSTPDNDQPNEDDQDSCRVVVIRSTLGDRVWRDFDADGVQDENEPGLLNVVVRLKRNGTVMATQTTDSLGYYLFDPVAAGPWTVDVDETTLPEEMALTTGNEPLSVTLAAGSQFLDADFGYQSGVSRIGDEVWYDANGDGVRNDTETDGIGGVTLMLKDGNGRLLETSESDSAGRYLFTALAPGKYRAEIDLETLPPGYSLTTRQQSFLVTIETNESYLDADFGVRFLEENVGSIGDYIWEDTDRDGKQDADEREGIPGIEVTLLDGSGNVIARDVTDDDGCYNFQGLEAGVYIVDVNTFDEDLPANYFLTTANEPMVIQLAEGQDFTKADFGFMDLDPNVGVIGDYTWHDANWNTSQDRGEEHLSFIQVSLFRDDALVDSVKTDIYGGYLFVNLPPGNYWVKAQKYGPNPPRIPRASTKSVRKERLEQWQMTTVDSFYVELAAGQVYRQADFGYAYPQNNWGGTMNKKVLARYMPWYADASSDSTLRHWDVFFEGGHADTSLFGAYDSCDPDLVEYQILSAWASGVDGFVVEWFGKEAYENRGTRLLLDKAGALYQQYHAWGFDFQVAISYNQTATGRLDTNLTYVGDSLMTHPAYWGTRDNLRRPLFLFDTEDDSTEAWDYAGCADTTLPPDVYLIWSGVDTTLFNVVDVMNPLIKPVDHRYNNFTDDWSNYVFTDAEYELENESEPGDLLFALGTVWPGFDDQGWSKGDDKWMARRDTVVYQQTWDWVHEYELQAGYHLPMPWCLVETWNDYNRASQVAPSTDWDYDHYRLTRDNARRFKRSVDPVGMDDLGMLVPQHIHQARRAAQLDGANASAIQALTDKARQHFIERKSLKAISYADIAAGLAISDLEVTQDENGVQLSWNPADKANGYLVYYSRMPMKFQPMAQGLPNSIPVGDECHFTLNMFTEGETWYIAVTAVDTALGPYANESWYANEITGVTVMQVVVGGDVSDAEEEAQFPRQFALSQNYPNPFNPVTVIQYALPKAQHVTLTVYDIRGRKVKMLVQERQTAGHYSIVFDGHDLASGIYFYHLKTGEFERSKRMMLIK